MKKLSENNLTAIPEEVSIVSAVEVLSAIADLDLSQTTKNQSEDLLTVSGSDNSSEIPIISKTMKWLHKKNLNRITDLIRVNFHTVYKYLRYICGENVQQNLSKESVEGVKTIMLLVTEAAENLDRYKAIFFGSHTESVKNLKEYADICSLYTKKIAAIDAEHNLAEKIHPIIQGIVGTSSEVLKDDSSILNLENVKRDSDYELFFLKKADGTRYCTPQLIRNMKLASRIEGSLESLNDEKASFIDISSEVEELDAISARGTIEEIYRKIFHAIDRFFQSASYDHKNALVQKCYSACIALLFSRIAYDHFELSEDVVNVHKTPSQYFEDIQHFIEHILGSESYKKLLVYLSDDEEGVEKVLVDCVHQFSLSVIEGVPLRDAWVDQMNVIREYGIKKASQEIGLLEEGPLKAFLLSYMSLSYTTDTHGICHVERLLKDLEEGRDRVFDPLFYRDIPTVLYDIQIGSHKSRAVRFPSPTRQESISSATLSALFKDAIVCKMVQYKKGKESLEPWLFCNLQQHKVWKDRARTEALENIDSSGEFSSFLHVITLPQDGDFYWQTGSYTAGDVSLFFKELVLHITGTSNDGGDCYWPLLHKCPSQTELMDLLQMIHLHIFSGKNILNQSERRLFIDYVHLCLLLQTVQVIRPSHLFITSKDGLDNSVANMAELYLFIKALGNQSLSKKEIDWMVAWLHGFELSERGRILIPEKESRLMTFFESVQDHLLHNESAQNAFLALFKGVSIQVART